MYMSTGAGFSADEAGGVWKSADSGVSWVRIFEAPNVWQTEVSILNANLILVNVPYHKNLKNPGLYLSQNGGESWRKINRGIGQPDKMTDIKCDPYDENIIWCAGWGSGWFKAIIK